MKRLTPPCPWCAKEATVDVPDEGWSRFMAGTHVQDAFPDLSDDERELLLTGFCPSCWDEVFGEMEDVG